MKSLSGIITVFSMILLLSNQSVKAQSKYQAPGRSFDLTGFNLQLPISDNGSIKEITGKQLDTYASRYFYLNSQDNSIHFYCSSDGVTTKDSHFPRTELRDITEWHFEGDHKLSVKIAVLEQPSTGNIIIGQIHGETKGTEAVKLRWTNGKIEVGVKEEVNGAEKRYTLIKNMPIGKVFNYSITQSGHEVTIVANDKSTKVVLGKTWDKESVYFKVGNYLQDNQKPNSSGLVAVYDIKK